MEIINDYNSFWLVLSIVATILIVTIGIVVIKVKDSSLFNSIFNRHVDEHIDTTGKFSLSHTEIVSGLPLVYHKEIHALEKEVRDNNVYMIKLIDRIETLADRITKLENHL